MDEWMHLTGGEASYRQHEQHTIRQATRTSERDSVGQRMRAALATTLVALAIRLDPARAARQQAPAPLAPAKGA
jgi:hypothetical protein